MAFVGFDVASDGLNFGLYDGDFDGCAVWSVDVCVGDFVGYFEGDNVGLWEGWFCGCFRWIC